MRFACLAKILILLLVCEAPCVALAAHGASALKVVEEIIIDAPAERVWSVLADFDHINWMPSVDRLEVSGERIPDQARRRVIYKDGAEILELLTKSDKDRLMFGVHRETDDIRRLPAVNYTSLVTLHPQEGGKTTVEWKARFYRGFPNNNPPPELNDDVAISAVKDMVRAQLTALKHYMESDSNKK